MCVCVCVREREKILTNTATALDASDLSNYIKELQHFEDFLRLSVSVPTFCIFLFPQLE